jgi:hypothetical protein
MSLISLVRERCCLLPCMQKDMLKCKSNPGKCNKARKAATSSVTHTWKLNSILIQTETRFTLKPGGHREPKRLNNVCIRISNTSWPTVFDICIMKYLNHLAPFPLEKGNNFLSFWTLHLHVLQIQDINVQIQTLRPWLLYMIGSAFSGFYTRWTRGIFRNKHAKVDEFGSFILRTSLLLCCLFNHSF